MQGVTPSLHAPLPPRTSALMWWSLVPASRASAAPTTWPKKVGVWWSKGPVTVAGVPVSAGTGLWIGVVLGAGQERRQPHVVLYETAQHTQHPARCPALHPRRQEGGCVGDSHAWRRADWAHHRPPHDLGEGGLNKKQPFSICISFASRVACVWLASLADGCPTKVRAPPALGGTRQLNAC